ncbi:hypothetical protein V7S43_010592 [Phytophthora oleae]|uniref:CSC1/OSCA1-like 7TM region domain-containing protein n=1 Tax=Phytophthora oleae TaxID=2107226 RepID=A0ABD3FEB9_9STRA
MAEPTEAPEVEQSEVVVREEDSPVEEQEENVLHEEQDEEDHTEDSLEDVENATREEQDPASADQVEVVEAPSPVFETEPHQALDMASLVESVHAELPLPSPRQNALNSFSRGASRVSSIRGGDMTREGRLQTMIKNAEVAAKEYRLGKGMTSVFQAHMDDIGALGIGMQLYFMLTKYLSVVFVIMGIISLPAIMVNSYGHGITTKMVDPLQLAYSSIGNGGVNSDTAAAARNCLPIGSIDCTWETVDTPLTSNPKTVTWIVTLTDVIYSFVFMCFLLFYSYRATKAIKEHQNKHLTPARYAVMVHGLPADATEKEILEHFNSLYDLNKPEDYRKLWFGCCWGRRDKVKRSRSKKAVNRNLVSNVDHLEGSTSINKDLYLNTWIAEVSVAHPTGGLLRTFLSIEWLSQKKKEAKLLYDTLQAEKSHSPTDFKAADEKLIHATITKHDKLEDQLKKKSNKVSVLRDARVPEAKAPDKMKETKSKSAASKEKLAAAAKAAKTAATNTQQAFNWEACECAFVVFNNLESRRRCLQDYRQSTRWLARKWQPQELLFRDTFPLIVTRAPEPSNILWENLEVTNRGRFYRQFVTNLVTIALLIISCAIISAAQTTQEQFASKTPPEGLCDRALPAVYYADTTFAVNPTTKRATQWTLAWNETQTCAPGSSGESRYHISYTNEILNALTPSRTSFGATYPSPTRCVDPCISESSTDQCNTLPCFYYNELVMARGMSCEAYDASHVLYCYCSTALTSSIKDHGFVEGPKMLWKNLPCRGFTKDYLVKNSFILLAAGIVVIVNFLLNTILRMFAVFERHTSESTRTIRVAVRMFGAQFLNTALIVMIVNASFGLSSVPVAKELLGGKYHDFQRGWYPTAGMGIATTMLLNAFLPQLTLFTWMYIWSPIYRWHKRRSIRTQDKMDKLYAGPTFDISERYPMVLNSVFVTLVFCGGSPVLLFIGAVASAGMYWIDKLSILRLYSVRTTYDEILGQVTIQVLPWTLALHLGFSAWMYGNSELLKGTMLNLPWLLRSVGLGSILDENPNATTDQLYLILEDKLGRYDVLGQYGFLVKIVYSHVMLMTVLCFLVTFGLLLYMIFGKLVFVVLGQMLAFMKQLALIPVELVQSYFSKEDAEARPVEMDELQEKEKLPQVMLPEFTEPFLMSVPRRYKPLEGHGFQKDLVEATYELTCTWPDDMICDGVVVRAAGDHKLTWETMQAPVKSYAIEANEKYQLAVGHVVETWEKLKKARAKEHVPEPVALGKVMPVLDNQVENAVTATEVITDTKEDELELAEETSEISPGEEESGSNDSEAPDVDGGQEAVETSTVEDPDVEEGQEAVETSASESDEVEEATSEESEAKEEQ